MRCIISKLYCYQEHLPPCNEAQRVTSRNTLRIRVSNPYYASIIYGANFHNVHRLSMKIKTTKIWIKMELGDVIMFDVDANWCEWDSSLQSVCPLNGCRREVSACYYTKCRRRLGHRCTSLLLTCSFLIQCHFFFSLYVGRVHQAVGVWSEHHTFVPWK